MVLNCVPKPRYTLYHSGLPQMTDGQCDRIMVVFLVVASNHWFYVVQLKRFKAVCYRCIKSKYRTDGPGANVTYSIYFKKKESTVMEVLVRNTKSQREV